MVQESADLTGAARKSDWPAQEIALAPGAACADCNSTWMDQIDREAERLIEPMVIGYKATIRRYIDQKALARWVSQVAILCDQSQMQQIIPADVPRRFYEDREPLTGLVIWLARTAAEPSVEAWERAWIVTGGTPPKATDRPNICLITFRVIQLVVQALIPLDGSSWLIDRGGNMNFLRKLWPSGYTPVSWPPQGALSPEAVQTLARAFEPPGVKPGDTWEMRPGS